MPLFSLSLHCRVPLYTLLRASWPLALRFLPVTAHLHCETTFSFQGHTMQYSHFRDLHVLYSFKLFLLLIPLSESIVGPMVFQGTDNRIIIKLIFMGPSERRENRCNKMNWIPFILFMLCICRLHPCHGCLCQSSSLSDMISDCEQSINDNYRFLRGKFKIPLIGTTGTPFFDWEYRYTMANTASLQDEDNIMVCISIR